MRGIITLCTPLRLLIVLLLLSCKSLPLFCDQNSAALLKILAGEQWKRDPVLYNKASRLFKKVLLERRGQVDKSEIKKIKTLFWQFQERPMAPAYKVELKDKDHRNGSKLKKYFTGDFFLVDEATLQKIPKVFYGEREFRRDTWVEFGGDGRVKDPSFALTEGDDVERLYVMDRFGQFYIHEEVDGDENAFAIKHSSFFSGKPVAASGKFIFDKAGKLKIVTNSSGHYRLGRVGMEQTLVSLWRHGVDLSNVEISLHADGKIVDSYASEWFESGMLLLHHS